MNVVWCRRLHRAQLQRSRRLRVLALLLHQPQPHCRPRQPQLGYINEWVNESTKQSVNQSISQPRNKSISHSITDESNQAVNGCGDWITHWFLECLTDQQIDRFIDDLLQRDSLLIIVWSNQLCRKMDNWEKLKQSMDRRCSANGITSQK